jgi:GH24 family phage-related lysozyme (muramidase)
VKPVGDLTVRRRARTIGVLALTAAAIASLAACDPLPPPPPPPANVTIVANAGSIGSGQSILSPNGKWKLAMQADGNLVERSVASGRALWTSKTPNHTGARLLMRADGVLAIVASNGAVVWSTPTYGVKGARLTLGDDANVIVIGLSNEPWWANGVATSSSARVPASQLHTSSQQITLTKMYEGLVATAPYANSGGNCTVGYGHFLHYGACTANDLSKTYDADKLFAADVVDHENRLKSSLGSVAMNQHEFDVLWDFVYGRGSLTASTAPNLYAAMTASPPNYAAVPGILEANGDTLIRGLCNRRYDEARIFAGGLYQRTSSC